jgi:hypothetical protein
MRKKELDSLQIVIFVKKEKTCLQCIWISNYSWKSVVCMWYKLLLIY